MGVCAKSCLGVSFFYVGQCVLWEWVVGGGGLYGLVSRTVVNEFTEDALTIAADILFQNATALMVKAYWRRWAKHVCWLEV